MSHYIWEHLEKRTAVQFTSEWLDTFPRVSNRFQSPYSVPRVGFAANTEKKNGKSLLCSWTAGKILLEIWLCLLWSNSAPRSSPQSLPVTQQQSISVHRIHIWSQTLCSRYYFSPKDHIYAKNWRHWKWTILSGLRVILETLCNWQHYFSANLRFNMGN